MKKKIKMSDNSINKLQIFIDLAVLFFRGAVYLIDRPPDSTYFIYRFVRILSLHKSVPNIFGTLGNSLPDFIHVFSFILITAGIVSCGKKGYLIITFAWLIIDCAFELGQRYNSLIIKMIPDWFSGVPILEAVKGYFISGAFDLNDIVAIILGASLAYVVLLKTMVRRKIL
jgi:hypothetical protein